MSIKFWINNYFRHLRVEYPHSFLTEEDNYFKWINKAKLNKKGQ